MATRLHIFAALAAAYVLGLTTGWQSCKGLGRLSPKTVDPPSPVCPPCVCVFKEATDNATNGVIFKTAESSEAVSTKAAPCLEETRRDVWEALPRRDEVQTHLARYSFEELWPQMQLWTMVREEKVKFMWDAVLKVNALCLEGDILEAGVWKGGCSMTMVLANMQNNTDRHFWLFDTFEGLPEPGPKDDPRSHMLWKQVKTGTYNMAHQKKRFIEDGKFNYGPKELVKNNLFWTGYPWEKLHFVQGKVEESLPATLLPPKFVILRLDTDWYQSTLVELEYLWDRLVPGGLLYIDDYCSWGGARTATQEFFEKRLDLDMRRFAERKPCLYYWKT